MSSVGGTNIGGGSASAVDLDVIKNKKQQMVTTNNNHHNSNKNDNNSNSNSKNTNNKHEGDSHPSSSNFSPTVVVPIDETKNHQQQTNGLQTTPTARTTNTTAASMTTSILIPHEDTLDNLTILPNNGTQNTMGASMPNGNGIQRQPSFAFRQQQIVDTARKAFASNKTKDLKFRKRQLRQLLLMVRENKDQIFDALRADLNKPVFESMLGEMNLLENELIYFLGNLDEFAKPKPKSKTFLSFFDSVYVHQEPLGVCLVMGAWNYPLLLSLSPFAGAIAAGNCVILKVSEHASFMGSLLEMLVQRYLDNECYQVMNCDLNATSHMLKACKFDHIFYTGGENGGRAVYTEASKNMTPVVLELGGKSPVYIDDAVIEKEAVWARLFWGKFLNAGQTCIAPDYVLCSEKAQDAARKFFLKIMDRFYQGDATNSPDYPRIINVQHFERLKHLVKKSRLVLGGQLRPDKLQIEPAIITDVSLEDSIMKEEIFGPLLPFVTVNSAQQAINIINEREKPLSLYVFSNSGKIIEKFRKETSSGGMVVNDVIVHISSVSLPFGGVGKSGFGKYHGEYSLETFSNGKAVIERGYNPLLEMIGSNRYPPYNDKKLWILTQLGMTRNIWYPGPVLRGAILFVSGAASVVAYNVLSASYSS